MYSGLIPADDAPDIVANTFLATLSDETLKNIRYSFLEHRERECYLTSFFFFGTQNFGPPHSQVNYQRPPCMDNDEREWKSGR
jgi:hypothetical protein